MPVNKKTTEQYYKEIIGILVQLEDTEDLVEFCERKLRSVKHNIEQTTDANRFKKDMRRLTARKLLNIMAEDTRWYTLEEVATILRYRVLDDPTLHKNSAAMYLKLLIEDGTVEKRPPDKKSGYPTMYRTK